jgi:hypothetical protein
MYWFQNFDQMSVTQASGNIDGTLAANILKCSPRPQLD